MPQGTDRQPEDERGGRDAFARLFQREAPAVYSWAAARLQRGERALAEDLVQEVWLRALNLFGAFEGPESGFRNWLFGIAQRVRLELMRELARHPAGGNWGGSGSRDLERVPAEVTSISSRIARDEELQIFLDRIARLSRDELELLELRGLAIERVMVPWAKVDHVVLVTSNIHMRRALGAFRAAGVEAIPAISRPNHSTDRIRTLLPSSDGLRESSRLARELIGFLYYRARGWVVQDRAS